MIFYFYSLIILLHGLKIALSSSENITLRKNPNFQMDFKTTIRIFRTDCFYHYYKQNDTLYMIVNIVNGGDLKANIKILDPNKKEIHNQSETSAIWFNLIVQTEGVYSLCIENKSVYEKLVYINLIDLSTDELVTKQAEKDEFEKSHGLILNTISNTTFLIHKMRMYQTMLKILKIGDSYFVEQNNAYVMYYSILQSAVIVICSIFQAYFIKKLFSVQKSKYSF